LVPITTIPRPPRSTPFPYTTLFRSGARAASAATTDEACLKARRRREERARRSQPPDRLPQPPPSPGRPPSADRRDADGGGRGRPDRKSTRLNSSHVSISYAVFCLKK